MEQAGGALPRGEGRGDLGRRMAQRRRVELVDAGLPRVKALVAQLRTEFGRTRPAQLVAPLFQRASKAGTSAGSGRVQTWSLKGAACPDAERIPAAVLTRRSSRLRLLLSSAGATRQCRFARGAQATSADARRPPPGVPATGMQMLFDESQGTAVVLQSFDSAADSAPRTRPSAPWNRPRPRARARPSTCASRGGYATPHGPVERPAVPSLADADDF